MSKSLKKLVLAGLSASLILSPLAFNVNVFAEESTTQAEAESKDESATTEAASQESSEESQDSSESTTEETKNLADLTDEEKKQAILPPLGYELDESKYEKVDEIEKKFEEVITKAKENKGKMTSDEVKEIMGEPNKESQVNSSTFLKYVGIAEDGKQVVLYDFQINDGEKQINNAVRENRTFAWFEKLDLKTEELTPIQQDEDGVKQLHEKLGDPLKTEYYFELNNVVYTWYSEDKNVEEDAIVGVEVTADMETEKISELRYLSGKDLEKMESTTEAQ
ncbi:hypothetical protein [Vaginisenegalia massiliensis]|uniref:hypothetical protein n=1 Tax=Vaginisenegalia massiliensis TaxID=2058294 RepID=UPI000F525753|nr:hypothetical protein [Vaginisenegalia massiliensis]